MWVGVCLERYQYVTSSKSDFQIWPLKSSNKTRCQKQIWPELLTMRSAERQKPQKPLLATGMVPEQTDQNARQRRSQKFTSTKSRTTFGRRKLSVLKSIDPLSSVFLRTFDPPLGRDRRAMTRLAGMAPVEEVSWRTARSRCMRSRKYYGCG
jgi:hypothetical protein